MNLLIVTTKKDFSCRRIIEEAEKKKIDVTKILYEDLSAYNLEIDKFNFCILRDPYNTGVDFSDRLRELLALFKKKQVLDYDTYKEHPSYEDKLFQHNLFGEKIPMPKFYHLSSADKIEINSFPVIAKKRISSRGKGIYIFNTKDEIEMFFNKNSISDYVFEEYIDIGKDIRIIIIGDEIIGAVERSLRIKKRGEYNGIGVRVLGKYNLPEEIKRKSVQVAKMIKCDLCGIDFAIDKKGKEYFVECNISPQFNSAERVLGINIAEKLVDFIQKK